MLTLNKITWARISACNVFPRLVFPGEMCRYFSRKVDVNLPEKPKKPITSFIRYLRDNKSSIEKEYPEAKWKDIMKIAAEKWRLCSPEEKKPYEEIFSKEREDYFYERNAYESKLTEDQKLIIEEIDEKRVRKREKAKVKKGLGELGKPKSPCGPYALFFASKKGQKIPGETLTSWASRIGSEWKNMPQIERQPYIDEAKALRLQYEKDYDLWKKEALQVKSENPSVKKAQKKLLLQEERRREKLINIESPPEPLATVITQSKFCMNSNVSENKSVVTAKTSKPGPLLESEETASVQTKLIEPSSQNSAIAKIKSYFLSSYQRLIKSASRIKRWDFSKLRIVAKTVKNDLLQ